MSRKSLAALVAGTALCATAVVAGAQSTDALIDKYTALAGSKENAQTLVNGLRNSDDFEIGGTTFATPTKKLGNGEINIALSLAEAKLGTANPTSAQLEAALEPILRQRADGMGWGQIANAMGFKLGDLVRSERAKGRDEMARTERTEKEFGRPDRAERPEKPERPERPERAERGR